MKRSTELSEKTCANQQSDTPVTVKQVKMSSTESDVMTEIKKKTGFSYAGEEDLLKCIRCEAEIKGYSHVKDKPLSLCAIHLWLSPSCPIVKGIPDAENILSRHNELIRRRLEQRNIIDAIPCIQRIVSETGDKLKSMLFYPPPCKQQYEELAARRRTLERLTNCPISKDDIAAAGFFYNPEMGKQDKVTCFWCHGSLRKWRSDDHPWAEHAKYYPGCSFLKQKNGTAYITEIGDNMTKREKRVAKSLAYVFDPDFCSYGHHSYNDVNSRLRSLRIGEVPNADEKAPSFAKQGFFWTHLDGEVIRCYYCGIRMPKEHDLDSVEREHKRSSQECVAAKGEIETVSSACHVMIDQPSHWLVHPCLCNISDAEYRRISNAEYGGDNSLECPACENHISLAIPFCQSLRTTIMQPREHRE